MEGKTPFQKECDRMRAESGYVETSSKLVALLYMLARDHMPIGVIEAEIDKAAGISSTVGFTNGWLALWAEDAAKRLEPKAT